ncbi:hypothetical protein F5051DRAFT_481266 [Lentinula edodes]|nr:hypothetical protein F5051DRAFT_481266 [Lentinula edodes]
MGTVKLDDMPLKSLNLILSTFSSFSTSLISSLLSDLAKVGLLTRYLGISLPRETPLSVFALSAKKMGFVWVDPRPDLILGEIAELAKVNQWKRKIKVVSGTEPGIHEGMWRLFGKLIITQKGINTILISDGKRSPFLQRNCSHLQKIVGIHPNVQSAIRIQVEDTVLDLGFEPENILVGGDSASAIIAYQLVQYTAMYNISSLPCPSAALLPSPPADSTLKQDPGNSMATNRNSNYIRSQLDAAYPPVALAGCLPASEIDTAWLSPSSLNIPNVELKGMFFKFSPTFILAGEAKMCRASMRVLWERMRVDMGVKVTYLKVAKPPHDLVGFEFMEPERSFAKRKIARWTDKVLSGSR